MKCPFCGFEESKVIDSRPTDEGERIRRRRECISCGKRFTTYEIIETVPIVVVKKDKSREVFDRNKLFNSMLKACEKRPVYMEQLEKAVSEIEAVLQNSLDREVTTVYIGELAMEKLRASTKSHMSASPPSIGSSRISIRSWMNSQNCSKKNKKARIAPAVLEFL